MDQQLDRYLLEASEDYMGLYPLLARYALLLSGSNMEIINHYGPKIEQLCLSWEPKIPVIRGIRMFSIGMSHFFSARFNDALKPLEEAMEILAETEHSEFFAMANVVYGGNNRSLGEFDTAVKHLMIAVDVFTDPNGHFAIYKAFGYYQLGEINVQIQDFERAEIAYTKSIEMMEAMNNDLGKFRAYNGMANFCMSQNRLEECNKYLEMSLTIEGLTDSQKSRSFCDLGVYYQCIKDYANAELNLKKSYDLRITSGLTDAASTSLINLAKMHMELEDYNEALTLLEEALGLCVEANSKLKIKDCHQLLAKVYTRLGMWKESTKSYEEFSELQEELNQKQLQRIYTIKNDQIQKQKAEIEEAHRDTQDSITYAKRIQNAILPSQNAIKRFLPNAFVLYMPKDIVAGDFYWLEPIDDALLFAAADCTGHGVPGAMVSVICNNALNRTVRECGLTDPGEILDKTREIVIQEFEKSDEEVRDGMDIALCSIQDRKIAYAGANNPLWILRDGEIIETKADRQPIGSFDQIKPFKTHHLELKEGDVIYIFTDGYQDQFGGPDGKKFKPKSFKELLISIHQEPMEVQHEILKETLAAWRGNLDQVDDVCVIGLRI